MLAATRIEEDFQPREAVLGGRLKEDSEAAANVTAALNALEDAREAQLRLVFGAGASMP